MKIIGILRVGLMVLLVVPWFSSGAQQVRSTFTKKNKFLPAGAFWIKNHWKSQEQGETAPVNWRSTENAHYLKINSKGLDTLFISGSAAPALEDMRWITKKYGQNHPVYIVDLRLETHLYINGLPVSLFYRRDEINWGKSSKKIQEEEQYWVNYFNYKGFILINRLGKPVLGFKIPLDSHTLAVKNTYTEEHAAKKAGSGYIRIEVPDYHPPAPDQVDKFLTFIKKIPKNSWLHFHCAAGKGRTTTFMVMRDIVANAKQIPLQTILTRQELLGGINLFRKSPSLSAQPWKKEYHHARRDYIRLFYTYVNSKAIQTQSFSDWIKKQPEGPYKRLLKSAAYTNVTAQ
jgi:hypothetical protein